MTISVSTWKAAQAAIASAVVQPHLHVEERELGRRFAADLDDAVRRYGVGMYVHEASESRLGNLKQVTTADQARLYLPWVIQGANEHFKDRAAHWHPTQREIAQGTALAHANDLKAQLNAHEVEASVHFTDDAANAVTAADAVDDATLITLVEAIRLAFARHAQSAGRLVVTRVATDTTSYRQRLAAHNERVARSRETIVFAERVARAAAIAFNYTYAGSGHPHELTPYTQLAPTYANVDKIRERLSNLHEAGTFSADPYFQVVRRASALLQGVGGQEPTPPALPGTEEMVFTSGDISTAAESALEAAIQTANRFAAAAAVK